MLKFSDRYIAKLSYLFITFVNHLQKNITGTERAVHKKVKGRHICPNKLKGDEE